MRRRLAMTQSVWLIVSPRTRAALMLSLLADGDAAAGPGIG
jgi:hypothetical protein